MRAFVLLVPFWCSAATLSASCASREPSYAEPARCIENDCSDQRPGWDAGSHSVHSTTVDDASVGDYVRSF